MSFKQRRSHYHDSEYDYCGEAPPPPSYQGYGYNGHGFNGDGYVNTGYVNGGYVNGGYTNTGPGYNRDDGYDHRVHEENKYQQNGRLGELGAVASTAFALLEGNKTGATSTHNPASGLPNIASLGSTAYAAYEQYEKYKGRR